MGWISVRAIQLFMIRDGSGRNSSRSPVPLTAVSGHLDLGQPQFGETRPGLASAKIRIDYQLQRRYVAQINPIVF